MNLLLNSDHDIELTASGQLALVSEEDSVLQRIKTRIMTFQGEWWINPEIGLPYLTDILGQVGPDLDLIRSLFTAGIREVPGVLSVDEITLEIVQGTRNLAVAFRCTATTGEQLQGEIQV